MDALEKQGWVKDTKSNRCWKYSQHKMHLLISYEWIISRSNMCGWYGENVEGLSFSTDTVGAIYEVMKEMERLNGKDITK